MRLLLVGALAALAVALPTGYHRKPSADERSELHRRAAAPWLNMEKRDACAELYDDFVRRLRTRPSYETIEAALESHYAGESDAGFQRCREQARRLVEGKIIKLKLEIEQKEQELKHLKRGDFLSTRGVSRPRRTWWRRRKRRLLRQRPNTGHGSLTLTLVRGTSRPPSRAVKPINALRIDRLA